MKEFLQNNEMTYEDNPYVEKNEFIGKQPHEDKIMRKYVTRSLYLFLTDTRIICAVTTMLGVRHLEILPHHL